MFGSSGQSSKCLHHSSTCFILHRREHTSPTTNRRSPNFSDPSNQNGHPSPRRLNLCSISGFPLFHQRTRTFVARLTELLSSLLNALQYGTSCSRSCIILTMQEYFPEPSPRYPLDPLQAKSGPSRPSRGRGRGGNLNRSKQAGRHPPSSIDGASTPFFPPEPQASAPETPGHARSQTSATPRPTSLKNYASLSDILHQQGYKETRVFTPEHERIRSRIKKPWTTTMW